MNNILEWENERLHRDDPLGGMVSRRMRMYYQYAEYNDAESKFQGGQMLSGFMCEGKYGSKIIVGYGNRRRSGFMNLAMVERINKEKEVLRFGLPFVKCRLNKERDEWMEKDVKEVEAEITSYCLLLPYVEGKKNFRQEYAVIYEDWDVGNANFEKDKMQVCGDVFEIDVMSDEVVY